MGNKYYIKCIKANKIHIFDGEEMIEISLDNPPIGHGYYKKRDANEIIEILEATNETNCDITLISEKEFVALRIDWCNDYLEHYF